MRFTVFDDQSELACSEGHLSDWSILTRVLVFVEMEGANEKILMVLVTMYVLLAGIS